MFAEAGGPPSNPVRAAAVTPTVTTLVRTLIAHPLLFGLSAYGRYSLGNPEQARKEAQLWRRGNQGLDAGPRSTPSEPIAREGTATRSHEMAPSAPKQPTVSVETL